MSSYKVRQPNFRLCDHRMIAMNPSDFAAPAARHYDVVIVGGAVMGSSTAYWLTENPDFNGSILIVERDPTYQFAASSLAASCIRQRYSQPLNVRISQFSVEFIRGFSARMQKHYKGEVSPDLSFREHGFLYCFKPEHAEKGRARAEMQRALHAERPLAASTIATLLSRLEKRGIVAYRIEGRQYVYRAVLN